MEKQMGTFSHSSNNSGGRYDYIINQNQLIKAFNDSRNALNYPLLKESKRQRFLIANSKGLEKMFYQMVNEDLSKAA